MHHVQSHPCKSALYIVWKRHGLRALGRVLLARVGVWDKETVDGRDSDGISSEEMKGPLET